MDAPPPPKAKSSVRTLDLVPDPGEIIKPAELIDISGVSHLSLSARRLYNKLVAHAFGPEMGVVGHEWTIPIAELRGTHRGNERLADSIIALMRTVVTVRLSSGQTRRVQLLGGNDMYDEERSRGLLTYSFDSRLVELLRNSTVFGKLEIAVMVAFSTKYALALYEAIARRARLRHKFSEEISLEEFRALLGVPTGKLTTYGNLNQFAIKPAVTEINALATFGVMVRPVKTGRRMTGVKIAWWMKSYDELRRAFAEVRRHSAGRKARIAGTVPTLAEAPVLPYLSSLSDFSKN
jgi:Initiator Replication protein